MQYQLNSQEKKELQKIKKAYYINPILSRIDQFIQSYQGEEKEAYKLVLNELNRIITDAHQEVDSILEHRVKKKSLKIKTKQKKLLLEIYFLLL